MNFIKTVLLSILALLLFSCNSDDDICTNGEATPRFKMKFKSQSTGKLKTLDSLYLTVDYGNGNLGVLTRAKVDSVLVPLRIDDSGFTEIYVKTSKNGPQSKLRFMYQSKTEYVSPACGVKKLYEQLSVELLAPNPVLSVETIENQIINENKTPVYLHF
ncbi:MULTISPECIES: DUF6452 family protein [Amniculibacterium]|jgi:hypothetical protein|uniref:DUF6452 family protein n=1 Tax=Amniculibacterium TaxID=2715289 RepID=UPI000F59388E|nr:MULTISPECIES: DUF6452 family protein [Amniculibacterium]